MKIAILSAFLILAAGSAHAGLHCKIHSRLDAKTLKVAVTGEGTISGSYVTGGVEYAFDGALVQNAAGTSVYAVDQHGIVAVTVTKTVVSFEPPPCPRCSSLPEIVTTAEVQFARSSEKFQACNGSLD